MRTTKNHFTKDRPILTRKLFHACFVGQQTAENVVSQVIRRFKICSETIKWSWSPFDTMASFHFFFGVTHGGVAIVESFSCFRKKHATSAEIVFAKRIRPSNIYIFISEISLKRTTAFCNLNISTFRHFSLALGTVLEVKKRENAKFLPLRWYES
jgi:hypothetical protein